MIIGFSTTNTLISRVLRWVTRSEASHSYTLFYVAGEPLVIHSTKNGVVCDYYKSFIKKNKTIVEFKLLVPEKDQKIALAYAIRLLGKRYDFLSILGFGWVLLNRSFGRNVKNLFPNRSAYQCSELALEIMRSAGLENIDAFDKELTSPEDLIHCLSAHTQTKEV